MASISRLGLFSAGLIISPGGAGCEVLTQHLVSHLIDLMVVAFSEAFSASNYWILVYGSTCPHSLVFDEFTHAVPRMS